MNFFKIAIVYYSNTSWLLRHDVSTAFTPRATLHVASFFFVFFLIFLTIIVIKLSTYYFFNTIQITAITGAVGGICALANILGEECCQLLKLSQQGKLEEARELQLKLIAPNQAVSFFLFFLIVFLFYFFSVHFKHFIYRIFY